MIHSRLAFLQHQPRVGSRELRYSAGEQDEESVSDCLRRSATGCYTFRLALKLEGFARDWEVLVLGSNVFVPGISYI